jgi:probable rRNA maturation factor
MYQIAVTVDCERVSIDDTQVRAAITNILKTADIRQAAISVAVVDDPTIHELNVRHLEHDYPTDVLSFLLEDYDDRLEGEIVVSADTAATMAERIGWPAENELLLYVVHGALHLVGLDDHEPDDRAEIRRREREVLAALGIDAQRAWQDDASLE